MFHNRIVVMHVVTGPSSGLIIRAVHEARNPETRLDTADQLIPRPHVIVVHTPLPLRLPLMNGGNTSKEVRDVCFDDPEDSWQKQRNT